jgi:hypothetical protein
MTSPANTKTVPAPGSQPDGRTPTDTLTVSMEGVDVLAADALWTPNLAQNSSGWHHVALVKDGASGNQSIWINGVCTASMQQQGNSTNRLIQPFEMLYIDQLNSVAFSAYFDELAIYDVAVPGALLYKHYNDSVTKHVPYTPIAPSTPAPPPPAYRTPDDPLYYMAAEYPRGTMLPSPVGDNNTCVNFRIVPLYHCSAFNLWILLQ